MNHQVSYAAQLSRSKQPQLNRWSSMPACVCARERARVRTPESFKQQVENTANKAHTNGLVSDLKLTDGSWRGGVAD